MIGGNQTFLAAQGQRRRQIISLTPLIDVVFILLVFFMLASSFLDWRAIDLNTPSESSGTSSLEGALLVELRPDGIRLSGERVSLSVLSEKISARVAKVPDQKVIVKAAHGISYQQAVNLLDRIAASNVVDLSLIRDQER